jgi:hypothetical protein
MKPQQPNKLSSVRVTGTALTSDFPFHEAVNIQNHFTNLDVEYLKLNVM